MENLYYAGGRRQRRKGWPFTPFLMILCIIVIFVLLLQIITSLRMKTDKTKRNQAVLYIERGDVEFQPWGQDTYDAYNQAPIWEGDKIRTEKDSYAILEFYDGSRIRINEGTEMQVEKIEAGKKSISVEIRLVVGEIWLNEKKTPEPLLFKVYAPHLETVSPGAKFAVAVNDQEFVRVMEGEVKVAVYDSFTEDPELLDSVSIGIGQQISVSSTDIEALEARKFVNLLESTDDYWKVTEWYLWNVREDENPTVYRAPEGEKNVVAETIGERSGDGKVPAESTADVTAGNTVAVPLPKVTVTNPSVSPYELTESRIYLKGTVSLDVTKVVVTEFYEDPKGKPYQLSKFVPGSGTWNYAAGIDFGNLKPGKNRFVVQAYSGDGLVSDPVEVIVTTSVQSEEESTASSVVVGERTDETIVEQPTVVEDNEGGTDVPLVEPPTPVRSITKTQPVIVSFADAEKTKENYFVTTMDRVVINGNTGGAKDVQKVIVNGWPLSLYTSGSPEWTYYAKSSINTLQRGVNVYNVYTEDSKGERSLSLTFTIEKK